MDPSAAKFPQLKFNFYEISLQRSNRGYTVSKIYAKVGEYGVARDWLQRYLDNKSEDPYAHKFMGEIYEHLQKPDQAITSYQRAYNLNSKQNDLIKSSKLDISNIFQIIATFQIF